MDKAKLIFIIIFIVVLFFVLHGYLFFTGKTYFGIDANLGVLKNYSQALGKIYNSTWVPNHLLGYFAGLSFNLSILLGNIFGIKNIILIDLFIYMVTSFFGIYIFLISSGAGFWGSFISATIMMFSTSAVYTVYAGHINGAFGFTILSLGLMAYVYNIQKISLFKKIVLLVFSGVSLGIGFADFQRTIYFGLMMFAYVVFMTIRKAKDFGASFKENISKIVRLILIPFIVFVSFIAFTLPNIFSLFEYTKMEQLSVRKDDPESKWRFLSQFSFPPEEATSLLVPGMFGYFSDENSEFPYWGRTGQDFDYEKTRQGMKNFRLHTEAWSVFSLPFLIFALIFAFRRKEKLADVLFWIGVLLVTFLLAIGRYFPTLWWLLIQIPYFDTMRNPGKWMDIFTVALVVLTGFGLNGFFSNLKTEEGIKFNLTFLKYLIIYPILLAVLYLIISIFYNEIVWFFYSSGFFSDNQISSKVVSNIISSIGTAILFSSIGTVILYLTCRDSFGRTVIRKNFIDDIKVTSSSWSTFLLIILFALTNVFFMFNTLKPLYKPIEVEKYYRKNELISFLESEFKNEPHRVLMFSGVANHYNTFLFPYYDLQTIGTIPQSRLPEDYTKFINYLNFNPVVIPAIFGTKYLILDVPPAQVANVPNLKYITNIVTKLSLLDNQERYFSHYIYELTDYIPKAYLTPNYIKYNGMLELVLSVAPSVLKTSVFLTNDITNFEPTTNTNIGIVSVEKYENWYIKLNVSNYQKGFLVLNEYYHPKWKCYVDGKEKEIYRANGLVRAVLMDTPGQHSVEFVYESASWLNYLQFAIFIISIILMAILGFIDRSPFLGEVNENME